MVDCLKNATILYVEDDEAVREGFTRALMRMGKTVHVAKDGQEGIELWEKYRPDIVISDIKMPRLGGIEMANHIKVEHPEQIIIFTTAHSDMSCMVRALSIGANAYITKPVDKDRLKDKLETLISEQYV